MNRKNFWKISSLLTLFSLLFVSLACDRQSSENSDKSLKSEDTKKGIAICVLRGTAGNEKVTGVVHFTQMKGYVLVEAKMEGLSEGKHGFHIHEFGDCNCADGKCTGGHFNPAGTKHGAPDSEERHAGDLGNIVADANGKASLSWKDKVIQLSGENSIIGRAIVVHAGEDDLTSQPTGAAGARVATGVIGIGKENKSAAASSSKIATCVIKGTAGNEKVNGTITFTQDGDKVKIQGSVMGLTPGKHGFHVHEFGDCNCGDGKCTGGHFNPAGTKHGSPSSEERHVGDLGNIEADAEGKATFEFTDSVIKLSGNHSIIGRAIIIHAGEDDLTSQPTGAAGARVGVGVIGIGKS